MLCVVVLDELGEHRPAVLLIKSDQQVSESEGQGPSSTAALAMRRRAGSRLGRCLNGCIEPGAPGTGIRDGELGQAR